MATDLFASNGINCSYYISRLAFDVVLGSISDSILPKIKAWFIAKFLLRSVSNVQLVLAFVRFQCIVGKAQNSMPLYTTITHCVKS